MSIGKDSVSRGRTQHTHSMGAYVSKNTINIHTTHSKHRNSMNTQYTLIQKNKKAIKAG